MKIGLENKNELGALVVLGVVAAYLVYTNLLSGPSATPAATPRPSESAAVPGSSDKGAPPDISRSSVATSRPGVKKGNSEFHPVLRSKKKEERTVDISKQDPSLRLDLLAKVLEVPPAGGERNLFEISKTPPVKATEVAALAKKDDVKIYDFVGPRLPPKPPPPQPPPPPPPPEPITLKYYGFTVERPDGKRTAYFLDGDEPLEAIEGATLKGRYRIVQIGSDKVLVEDTKEKRRQSLNLEPEPIG